jgi:Protein of unknown function (DUF2283)
LFFLPSPAAKEPEQLDRWHLSARRGAVMTLSYDEVNDVLYVTFAHPEGSVRHVETERGDVLRYSNATHEIVGVTILFFADRARRGEKIEVPEVLKPGTPKGA